jgi:hypothetical protein
MERVVPFLEQLDPRACRRLGVGLVGETEEGKGKPKTIKLDGDEFIEVSLV